MRQERMMGGAGMHVHASMPVGVSLAFSLVETTNARLCARQGLHLACSDRLGRVTIPSFHIVDASPQEHMMMTDHLCIVNE